MEKWRKKIIFFMIINKSCASLERDGTKMVIYADAYLRLNKSALTINNALHKVESGNQDKWKQSQDEWLFLAFALLLPLLELDCWNAFSLIKWTNNNDNNSYQLKKQSAQLAQGKRKKRGKTTSAILGITKEVRKKK